MNRLTIIGNMTKDPMLKKVTIKGEEVSVLNFTLAVNRKKGEDAIFFNCTAWRGAAELLARYGCKGKKIAVIGPVSLRKYTSKEGVEQAQLEVEVDEFEFCSPKSDADDTGLAGMVEVKDADLPF